MGLADDIRAYVFQHLVAPAQARGEVTVAVRSGDVHRDMRLHQRMPSVCAALESRRFETEFGVRLVDRSGPDKGANAVFVLELLSLYPALSNAAHTKRGEVRDGATGARPGIVTEETVYLVSCVSKKLNHTAPARDLYVSDWFRKARRYVEGTELPWFILSAKHGLVSPDQVLEPYEVTLNAMAVAQRRRWAAKVDEELKRAAPDIKHVSFLAGARYREFLQPLLETRGVTVDVPMEGLRIGEQLAWLSSEKGCGHD